MHSKLHFRELQVKLGVHWTNGLKAHHTSKRNCVCTFEYPVFTIKPDLFVDKRQLQLLWHHLISKNEPVLVEKLECLRKGKHATEHSTLIHEFTSCCTLGDRSERADCYFPTILQTRCSSCGQCAQQRSASRCLRIRFVGRGVCSRPRLHSQWYVSFCCLSRLEVAIILLCSHDNDNVVG